MKRTAQVAGLYLLFTANLAMAASTVIVNSPVAGETRIRSTIEMLDRMTLRIHVGAAADYLLVLGNKLYSAEGDKATDISSMRLQIRMPSIGDENIHLMSGLEDTGRVETVAGLPGKVFNLRYYDKDMQSISEEIVLSDDSRARDVTEAWKTYFDKDDHTQLRGHEVLHDYLSAHQLGVLRLGHQYSVEGFGVVPAADRFALPSTR